MKVWVVSLWDGECHATQGVYESLEIAEVSIPARYAGNRTGPFDGGGFSWAGTGGGDGADATPFVVGAGWGE